MSHHSLAIANKVLDTAEERGLALSNMQLIKLIYIAHGWTLALLGKPLVKESPQAWQHGPVYRDVYHAFRDSGWSGISKRAVQAFTGTDFVADLSDNESSILKQVVEGYGHIDGFTLSDRTHQPGTPWTQIWDGGKGKFRSIPNELIKQHFLELSGSGT